jgi:nitrogen regulatory protein PII
MKLVVAIIPTEKLEKVQKALNNNRDVCLMTASEVLDCRQSQATTEIYRGRAIKRPASKLRLEIAVEDSCFGDTVEAIERSARYEEDRKDEVFVMGLDEYIHIGAWGRERVTSGR